MAEIESYYEKPNKGGGSKNSVPDGEVEDQPKRSFTTNLKALQQLCPKQLRQVGIRVVNLKSIVPDKVSTPAKLSLAGVVLNGLGNGVFNVVLQLYMISLGFSSTDIAAISMMNAVGMALLVIPAGVVADRYGRARVVSSGFIPSALSMLLILMSKSVEVFRLAFLLLGVGNATGSIFTPIFSSFFDREDMDRAFGLLGFLSIISASMGSLLGFVPPMLVARYGLELQSAYWIVMMLAAVFFAAGISFLYLSLRGVVEPRRREASKSTLRSKSVVAKFSLLNMMAGLGYGVFFSLFPYYVNRRFDVESDSLGSLYFVSNFVQAGASILAARVSKRVGTLKVIVASIGLSASFYLMIPLSPSFGYLSAAYIGRLCFMSLSDPLTSSLFMRMLHEEEKATAHSTRMMANQLGHVISPWVGGQLMENMSLDLPAYLGAGICALYSASYYLLMKNEKEVNHSP